MFNRKSAVYAVVVTALLLSTIFGAYAVNAQTGTTPTTAPAAEESQTGQPADPAQMAGAMAGMLDQMEAILAAAPDDATRQRMAPAMMNTLNGMMGLNQAMMEQMGSMPAANRQAMAGPMMEVMSRMTGMMGQMQPMMGSGTMGSGSPMTATQSMQPMGGGMQMGQMMGMMGQMMQMMGQMQSMMDGGMMGEASPMTGAMPMTGTMPMTDTMPMTGTQAMGPMGGGMQMGGDGQMGQMMQMMGMMMQMMGRMHGMMGGGMMGEGMMGGAGMGPMGPTSTVTGTAPAAPVALQAATAESTPQTIEGGGVTVKVTPLNLSDDTADTLEFEVVLDTHTVELNYDIAQLAILRDNLGNEYTPASWAPEQSGGHHVSGLLSFADRTAILQTGVTSLELDVTNIAGVSNRLFQWSVEE